jgi:predicted dehydrogenase
MMDILLFFFGSVATVKGASNNQAKPHQVDDVTSGFLVFDSGVQGTIQLTFNGGYKEDHLQIIGDQGHIDLSIMSNDPIQLTIEGVTTEISFEAMD